MSGGLFWRQFRALVWKNWIVLSKHPILNILRCFLMPVAYGIFLAVAQLFLSRPNNYGIGDPIPVYSLQSRFDPSTSFYWVDGTNGTSNPTPSDIMARITVDFTPEQLNSVKQLPSPTDIPAACPQNFNLFSECFAAIAFYDIPANGTAPINYTIRADAGLFFVDVERHTSEFEERILPLQWAIDQAIISLKTGTQPPTPLEWPFTQVTNEEQARDIRLSYIRGLRTLLVLALFVCYIGIAYQLPGSVAGERANLLTAHMRAMGLLDSARILSWHVSISLAYLPAWVIVSIIWHYRIFSESSTGLIFVVHVLLGLSIASWSFFVAAPFGKSPQLAAVASTFLGVLFAILALVMSRASTGAAFIFSVIFPPGYYIFAIRAICGWENHLMATNVLRPDPDSGLRLLPLLIAAIIDIFLWPYLAVLLERKLYEVKDPSSHSWFSFGKRKSKESLTIPNDVAISIRNLNKTWTSSLFGFRKSTVTGITDLSIDVPKTGIYVLLGSNGAGKSTTLSILAGLTGSTGGSVVFEGGVARPPRGTIGIVPQKNVLFPELTCLQTLKVWREVKWSSNSETDEDPEQLLTDCDLTAKINSNSNTLSGGQKRKLQLAIGLIGGSKIVLVDECTSGVDPLSRRALWRTLTSFRQERTIIFTTHFLDEADLLADNIAILASPGKLVAHGSPVSLKRDLGEGYHVQVMFKPAHNLEKEWPGPHVDLLLNIQIRAPGAYCTSSANYQASYHLKTRDPVVVNSVLTFIDENRDSFDIVSYDIIGTSIEDIFLDLMNKNGSPLEENGEKGSRGATPIPTEPIKLNLSNGKKISPLRQALTIFYKRYLIARRSWLTPLLMVIIAIAGCTVPTFFITNRQQTCGRRFARTTPIPLYLPNSPIIPFSFGPSRQSQVLLSPPGIIDTLGPTTAFLRTRGIDTNDTFVDTIRNQFRNLSVGGISVDLETGVSLVAWEATPPGLNGPALLNFASNILLNHALNASGDAEAPTLIRANYEPFPAIAAGTLASLRWMAFFGAAMAVYPAFFALYVSKERRTSVQAMQMSNGLTNPIGLWLGHLMFDAIFSVVIASVITIVFATVSNQFHGEGLFWVVMVLYGITGALFAYCGSLITSSPLAAFAAVAGYQIIMFVLYLAGYLLVLTYAKTSDADTLITIIHFTLSLISPVASVLRAALVSVNLFSLLCAGNEPVTTSEMGNIMRFGGPIVYLIIYSFFLLAVLVWVDSGSRVPRGIINALRGSNAGSETSNGKEDVAKEAKAVSQSKDLLRILDISKSFGKSKVVDNVSLGVSKDIVLALLGPNGAGKTTTFNIIRGDIIPDTGDVLLDGTSVVRHPQTARLSLGVCPQFTAIDAQLTVREHLLIYARLKGLSPREGVDRNVEAVMHGAGLSQYADRLANKLSGGNQRKLALAIALLGNPAVVLIDEFSTGVDAKMKRDMWKTLRNVAHGKAVIITTHSMEEASALASKVGIIAKRLLAIGTTEELSSRHATYEVHFSCRTREEILRAQTLMSTIPGSRMADDVATRFEVPINDEMTLAELFRRLSESERSIDAGSDGVREVGAETETLSEAEYTVEKATLESVFLRVIRDNNVAEEDTRKKRRWF